jgi:hypothetical protein
MHKRFLCFFIFVLTLMMLPSCSRLSSSIETAEIVLNMDATTPPTIVPKATMDMYIEKYINWLNQYPSAYGQPVVSLSPNGLYIFSFPDPFLVGKDTITIIYEQTGAEIDIPLDYDLLGLTKDAVPDGKLYLHRGSLSADHTTWTPDSTAFLLKGGVTFPWENGFLIIYNIHDPDKADAYVVSWDYAGDPYTAWSPDSTSLLIWFGPEIPLGKDFNGIYTEEAWIVNRQGGLLKKIDVRGFRSPFWAGRYLYAIKNEREIWIIDPLTGNSEPLYANEINPVRILDRNLEGSQLLIIELAEPINLLIFDIESQRVIDRIPSLMSEKEAESCYGISTSSDYTGIFGHYLYIFNWQNHTLEKRNDRIGIVTDKWSPVVNGFVAQRINNTIYIIYP